MRRTLSSLVLILSVLASGAAHSDASVAGKPKVSFHAEGSPGALDIEGTTADLRVGDDGKTLTVRLKIRAAPCDKAHPDGHGAIADRAEHLLRFVREGEQLVPDAATKALIERYGWNEPI